MRRKTISLGLLLASLALVLACTPEKTGSSRGSSSDARPSRPPGSVPAGPRGQIIGSGGGIAEKRVSYAYLNLENYLSFCLTAASCRVSKEDRDLLEKIRDSLPEERSNPSQLQFASELRNPGLFHIEEMAKAAITGTEVGSPIIINSDFLYSQLQGKTEPIDLGFAISLLIHELGHHHHVSDETRLDLLGARVQGIMAGHIQQVSFKSGGEGAVATVIDLPGVAFPQLLINSEYFSTRDFSDDVKREMERWCQLDMPGSRLVGFSLWNVHWELETYGPQLKDNPVYTVAYSMFHVRMRAGAWCDTDTHHGGSFGTQFLILHTTLDWAHDDERLKETGYPRFRKINCYHEPEKCPGDGSRRGRGIPNPD